MENCLLPSSRSPARPASSCNVLTIWLPTCNDVAGFGLTLTLQYILMGWVGWGLNGGSSSALSLLLFKESSFHYSQGHSTHFYTQTGAYRLVPLSRANCLVAACQAAPLNRRLPASRCILAILLDSGDSVATYTLTSDLINSAISNKLYI
ncbi:hypothetical protein DL96DRAFT_1613672 [Flagelloscypha sp. PMI_526]|nr:hypothetical protein DL96DRAFT_1613672 [Flagelloscypha sp. PMI_526]